MKYLTILASFLTAVSLSNAQATTVLNVDFASGYIDGALVGQNNWAQTSTVATNPQQVTSGQVVLPSGTTGQDTYKGFASVVDATVSGNYLLSTINFSVTAATAGGDYFFHLSSPAGTTSVFVQRFFVRSATGGFELGINPTSGGSATYGSTILSLNTPYTAVTKWDFVAGATNDLMTIYVDPTDPIITNNTAYASSSTWGQAEPTTVAAANLRIGGSTTTPGVLINSIEVQSVPEPSTVGLAIAGGLGLAGIAARRRLWKA